MKEEQILYLINQLYQEHKGYDNQSDELSYDLNTPEQRIDVLDRSEFSKYVISYDKIIERQLVKMINFQEKELEKDLKKLKTVYEVMEGLKPADRESFIKSAKRHVGKKGHSHDMVIYYPNGFADFRNMTKKQLDFYYFLREFIHNGDYDLKAPVPYYILYLYEVLTLVDTQDKEEALEILYNLTDQLLDYMEQEDYAEIAPSILDFVIENDLTLDTTRFNEYFIVTDDFTIDATLTQQEGKDLKLGYSILSYLADVDKDSNLWDNSFFGTETRNKFKENITLIDKYLKENNDSKGILEIYGSNEKKKFKRKLYANTPIEIPEEIEVEYTDYYSSKELRDLVRNVAIVTENAIRDKYGLGGKIFEEENLDPKIKEIILKNIDKKITP